MKDLEVIQPNCVLMADMKTFSRILTRQSFDYIDEDKVIFNWLVIIIAIVVVYENFLQIPGSNCIDLTVFKAGNVKLY